MAARSKKPTGGRRQAIDADAVVAEYAAWLGRQPLAGRSRDAYLAQMRGFLTWLAGSERGGAALVEPGVRDRAVRDYKRHVQTARHWAPSTVNQALAAIDSFYRSIGVGRPEVAREELARVAPRALAKADQRRFLRAVEGCPSARDRAIATVFFYTGLRLSELAALEVGDLSVSAHRGRLRVRSGKGDADPGGAPQQRLPPRHRRVDHRKDGPGGRRGRDQQSAGGECRLVAVAVGESHQRPLPSYSSARFRSA
jgi:integrase